jgi:hypothetical protein
MNMMMMMMMTNVSVWETMTQRRKITRICALFKAYIGEPAWKSRGQVKRTMLPEQM